MLVVGEKEVEEKAVSVRKREEGDLGQIGVEDFIEKIKKEIENKR
ncbi:His/Gly/Thr/Pro-type tRNA ligase C-terminal domain-containing protein [Anaerosalibacter bizertensis]|nr:His/Gly/Thr/Pro-type tRNA ligase C-terminal domain-containing protein [Anaerosalibacter bizertensis]